MDVVPGWMAGGGRPVRSMRRRVANDRPRRAPARVAHDGPKSGGKILEAVNGGRTPRRRVRRKGRPLRGSCTHIPRSHREAWRSPAAQSPDAQSPDAQSPDAQSSAAQSPVVAAAGSSVTSIRSASPQSRSSE
jgi:hypothetical protein